MITSLTATLPDINLLNRYQCEWNVSKGTTTLQKKQEKNKKPVETLCFQRVSWCGA